MWWRMFNTEVSIRDLLKSAAPETDTDLKELAYCLLVVSVVLSNKDVPYSSKQDLVNAVYRVCRDYGDAWGV